MTHPPKTINIIGVASCYGARDLRCANAPSILKHLRLKESLKKLGFEVRWDKNIYPDYLPVDQITNNALVLDICKQLARQVHKTLSSTNKSRDQTFVVIGGDHSCAIGTWSGVKASLNTNADFGLIWIDAHMDSHTPQTSPSGAIHGMPLAVLLGHGDDVFCKIETKNQKLKPENLCLIGIRSYEQGEIDLLRKLGVKIFYMEDVEKLGLEKVIHLAQIHVKKHTQAYGLSIDLDAIDPLHAPGVGSPENNGLNAEELIDSLLNTSFLTDFVGIEVAELNSTKDSDNKTAKLAIQLIEATLAINSG